MTEQEKGQNTGEEAKPRNDDENLTKSRGVDEDSDHRTDYRQGTRDQDCEATSTQREEGRMKKE
jgi:hypothetical protein